MVSGFATLLPGAEGDDEGPDAGEEEGRRVGAKGRVCVGGAGGKGRGVWGYEAKGGDVCGGVWGVGKGGEGGRSTRLCLPHEHTRPVCMMHRRGRPVSAAAPCWLSHSQPPPSLKLPPFDPVGYPPRPLILPPPHPHTKMMRMSPRVVPSWMRKRGGRCRALRHAASTHRHCRR